MTHLNKQRAELHPTCTANKCGIILSLAVLF